MTEALAILQAAQRVVSAQRFYLCGPMSGIPKFNIPKFDEVASQMRHRGYRVISPAELDDPEYRDACLRSDGQILPQGQTWGALLARDVQLIGDQIDAIVLLPGWHRSRGARLEVFVGLLKPDLCFYEWSVYAEALIPIAREEIRTVMRINMP